MSADDEIKFARGEAQLESIALCKLQARGKRRVAAARVGDGPGQNIDANNARLRVEQRQARGDLAAATADVGDAARRRELVARQQPLFLWPDGTCLRGKRAHQRL